MLDTVIQMDKIGMPHQIIRPTSFLVNAKDKMKFVDIKTTLEKNEDQYRYDAKMGNLQFVAPEILLN